MQLHSIPAKTKNTVNFGKYFKMLFPDQNHKSAIQRVGNQGFIFSEWMFRVKALCAVARACDADNPWFNDRNLLFGVGRIELTFGVRFATQAALGSSERPRKRPDTVSPCFAAGQYPTTRNYVNST